MYRTKPYRVMDMRSRWARVQLAHRRCAWPSAGCSECCRTADRARSTRFLCALCSVLLRSRTEWLRCRSLSPDWTYYWKRAWKKLTIPPWLWRGWSRICRSSDRKATEKPNQSEGQGRFDTLRPVCGWPDCWHSHSPGTCLCWNMCEWMRMFQRGGRVPESQFECQQQLLELPLGWFWWIVRRRAGCSVWLSALSPQLKYSETRKIIC